MCVCAACVVGGSGSGSGGRWPSIWDMVYKEMNEALGVRD